MAVPKKRTSVSRKGMRHAGQHHKLYLNLSHKCECGALNSSHCVCAVCGKYKGRQVFVPRDRTKSDENADSTPSAS